MNTVTQTANKMLQEQGYIIISFHQGPKPFPEIGSKLTDSIMTGGAQTIPGPFFVIGTATTEEYLEQARRYEIDSTRSDLAARTAIGFLKLVAE